MNYLHYPLNVHEQGKVVEFTIDHNSYDVMILDDLNLARFKSGNEYEFIGCQAKQSPEMITIPDNKRWHAVVDFGDYDGTSKVSVRML